MNVRQGGSRAARAVTFPVFGATSPLTLPPPPHFSTDTTPAAPAPKPTAAPAGARTHDLMPAYYRQFFPYEEFMAWLAYGNGERGGGGGGVGGVVGAHRLSLSPGTPLFLITPTLFFFPPLDSKHPRADPSFLQRRELCFTLDGDIFVRYLSFKVRRRKKKGGREGEAGRSLALSRTLSLFSLLSSLRPPHRSLPTPPHPPGRRLPPPRHPGPHPRQDRHRPRLHCRPRPPGGLRVRQCDDGRGRGRGRGRPLRLCARRAGAGI